jgi:hypothetical protein
MLLFNLKFIFTISLYIDDLIIVEKHQPKLKLTKPSLNNNNNNNLTKNSYSFIIKQFKNNKKME